MGDDIRNRFKSTRSDYSTPVGRTAPPPPSQPKTQNMFGQQIDVRPKTPQQKSKPNNLIPKTKKRKKPKIKIFIILFILLFISLVGAGAYYFLVYKKQNNTQNMTEKPVTKNNETSKPNESISMLVTGDFLAYDSVNSSAKTEAGYDYLPMMTPLKPIFDKTDVKYCSQSTMGGGVNFGVSGFPAFNAGTEWSKGLLDLGCNVINVGSNHTNDKGQEVITSALNYYDENKNILAVNGANRSLDEQAKIRYFTVKQLKFAFLAYTTSSKVAPPNAFGVNMYNAESAKRDVELAKKEALFVIVGINWGKEDSGDIQPEQEAIAQELTLAGADMIIGNGPHIVQPVKILNGKDGRQSLVWFSLGNAVNSQLPNDNLFGGIGLVDIDVSNGNMKNPRFLPTYMHYEWTEAQKRNNDLNARKNLMWYPLDLAASALASSQTGTTIEAQTNRLKGIVSKFLPVTVIKSTEYN